MTGNKRLLSLSLHKGDNIGATPSRSNAHRDARYSSRDFRGRKNTERIAERNLYRPATREWLLLDENPAKSCERYSRKSMTRCVYPRLCSRSERERGQSRYSGDTFTQIFSSLSSMWSPLPFSLARSSINLGCLLDRLCVALSRDSLLRLF